MMITIDIQPDKIYSPQELGELVIEQAKAEAEGKRYDPKECKNLFQDLMSLANNQDLFLLKLSRA